MGDKPRVLHIITKMVTCGGASRSVCLMAQRQNRVDSEVEAAIARGFPEAHEEELDPGPQVTTFRVPDLVRPLAPLADLRAMQQLRSIIRQWRPSVVHTHSTKSGVLGRLVARQERVPVIVHHVRSWGFLNSGEGGVEPGALRKQVYLFAERYAARLSHAMLYVARSDMELARELRIGSPETSRVVRSGIEVESFLPATPENRRAARELMGIGEGSFVLGTVAQMRAQKAPLDFVSVAQRVAEQVQDAVFVWIGDGPLKPQVDEAVRQAGLAERFRFMGSRDDVGVLYAGLDVFMLTSLWEGLPRSVVEACMVGLPIVATSVPGTCEVVQHRHNGLLAEPGDVHGLASQALELYANPGLRRFLGDNARKVGDEFSLDRTVADLGQLYTELLAASGALGPR